MTTVGGELATLVPSQAMSSRSTSTSSLPEQQHQQQQPPPSQRRNRRSRGARRRGQHQQQQQQQQPPPPPPPPPASHEIESEVKQKEEVNTSKPAASSTRRNRNRRPKQQAVEHEPIDAAKIGADDEPSSARKKKARRKPRKKYPWRRHIPAGSVDPITLDPLVSLPYPPFALAATEPYVPVPEWPIQETQEEPPNAAKSGRDPEDERQQRILREQWGLLHPKEEEDAASEGSDINASATRKHYNLFDGRALAYYLVSQLQFIDPFNRRDLTREELVNLDAYLFRHGFTNLKVVEAYDAKGVTISRSGALGATAQGRAEILQQEARVLLNSLFGGGHYVTSSGQNELQRQYAATQRRHDSRRHETTEAEDSGIYATEGGGMVVIDDDENPGLRGTGFRSAVAAASDGGPTPGLDAPNTLWSASHITARLSQSSNMQERNFPALPMRSATEDTPSTRQERDTPSTGPSKSLLKITKAVSKTDPDEIKRQLQAREEARRRAMLANLSFVPPGTEIPVEALASVSQVPVSAPAAAGPTEGQLLRNQALASALGVTPSTARRSHNQGWSRPTDGTIQMDEFGNELNSAKYPDSLIKAARERMDQVLKLEKRWKTFLADDTSASLPLRPMDRPLRTFVHEYSDYWRLHTESFDPEPKRYIHCVKLRDTSAPVPLLSEAARQWRGPSLQPQPPQPLTLPRGPRDVAEEDASGQAAGQATMSREFPPPPPREPLKLKPRSKPEVEAPPGAMFEMAEETAPPAAEADVAANNELSSRFGDLLTDRQRPKLVLAPRTVPLELPPFQPAKTYDVAEERERQQALAEEKARKQREAEEKEKALLMKAFASSDEEGSVASAESSEWEDEEEQYSGSDSE